MTRRLSRPTKKFKVQSTAFFESGFFDRENPDHWSINHFDLCHVLTVNGESFLDEVSNLFFRPRLHIEAALDFDAH